MKTKLTLLAAVLLAGIASTTAVIGRDWVYTPPAPKATTAPAKDHCDMGHMAGMKHEGGMCDMSHMAGMSGKGGMCDMSAAPAAKAHKGCCN